MSFDPRVAIETNNPVPVSQLDNFGKVGDGHWIRPDSRRMLAAPPAAPGAAAAASPSTVVTELATESATESATELGGGGGGDWDPHRVLKF